MVCRRTGSKRLGRQSGGLGAVIKCHVQLHTHTQSHSVEHHLLFFSSLLLFLASPPSETQNLKQGLPCLPKTVSPTYFFLTVRVLRASMFSLNTGAENQHYKERGRFNEFQIFPERRSQRCLEILISKLEKSLWTEMEYGTDKLLKIRSHYISGSK